MDAWGGKEGSPVTKDVEELTRGEEERHIQDTGQNRRSRWLSRQKQVYTQVTNSVTPFKTQVDQDSPTQQPTRKARATTPMTPNPPAQEHKTHQERKCYPNASESPRSPSSHHTWFPRFLAAVQGLKIPRPNAPYIQTVPPMSTSVPTWLMAFETVLVCLSVPQLCDTRSWLLWRLGVSQL